jgi:hypothetical protein
MAWIPGAHTAHPPRGPQQGAPMQGTAAMTGQPTSTLPPHSQRRGLHSVSATHRGSRGCACQDRHQSSGQRTAPAHRVHPPARSGGAYTAAMTGQDIPPRARRRGILSLIANQVLASEAHHASCHNESIMVSDIGAELKRIAHAQQMDRKLADAPPMTSPFAC